MAHRTVKFGRWTICAWNTGVKAIRSMVLSVGLALVAPMSPAAAHPNHGMAIDQAQATAIAYQVLAQLISQGAVPRSWAEAVPLGTLQQELDGEPEWVLSFLNPAIEDKAQQVLNIVLAENGTFIAATYSDP
jgi:hypothetical protein